MQWALNSSKAQLRFAYCALVLQIAFSFAAHPTMPMRWVFRTMRSRDHDVVVVRRTINLGYWEFGMGREWGGVEKGEVSLRVT